MCLSPFLMNKGMILTRKLRGTQCQVARNISTRSSSLQLSTCNALLQLCAENKELSRGRMVHSHMLSCGHINYSLSCTSLINMYSKCCSIADALSVFYESAHVQNVFVYNAMIAGLTLNDSPVEAFDLFCQMRLSGIAPDSFTFPCVIKVCPDFVCLKNTHGLLFKLGLDSDPFIGSSLVHCYLKFELVSDAVKAFDGLPERDDIVIWNAMINGYVQIGEFGEALVIVRRMADIGLLPNKFTVTGVLSALAFAGDIYNGKLIHAFSVKLGHDLVVAVSNALVDMYGKCRELVDALVVFENTIEKDVYSWNSIISVHEQGGNHDGTLRLLKRMLSSGFRPDLVTVTAALPACSYLTALMRGKEIHGCMIINGMAKTSGTYIENAVMDMYAKCGSMREARLAFESMKIKDVASWNIMVTGYGMHGYGNEALDMFSTMQEAGLKPDEISFVGLLTACSHAGFVIQGRELLAEMQQQYGVTPAVEHYSCVIDMLGRAGQLDEAYKLLSNMPIKPNQVVWRTFVGACRLHGNASLAEIAIKRVLELEPEHCGSYVLMSNIYGESGKYEEVANLRNTMRQQDVNKLPGCSWVELSTGVHLFYTGDRGHPDEHFVYERLDSLTACLIENDCVLDVWETCT